MVSSPSNKAQIGNTFTWLFVIIAGSAFLLAFYQLIQAQLSEADTQAQQRQLDAVSETLDALYTSSNTNQTLPGFRKPYNLTCQQGALTITTPTRQQELTTHPVYTTTALPTTSFTALTAEYNAPLPVTTVLFLIPTSTEIPYPENEDLPPRQLHAHLNEVTTTPSLNTTTTPQGVHGPTNKAGLLHTNNTELFTCAQQQIYDQATTAYQTLQKKAQSLHETTPPRCNNTLQAANTTLNALIQHANDNANDTDAFTANVTALQTQNEALLTNSCPPLY